MSGRLAAQLSAAAAGAFVASQVVEHPAPLLSRGPAKPSTPDDVPGQPLRWTTSALEAGQRLSQSLEGSFAPIRQIHQHVDGFHAYAHDFTRQVEAHHYCSHPTEDFRQCVIYDSDQPNACLIGVEYIISRPLFEALPGDEKKFWHSHQYEVLSGLLVAPGVPEAAERAKMAELADTYGKTIHTWQFDRGDSLPYGPPQLMEAFTDDGQVCNELVWERDARYGIDSMQRAKSRQGRLMHGRPACNTGGMNRHYMQTPPSPGSFECHRHGSSAWRRLHAVPTCGHPALLCRPVSVCLQQTRRSQAYIGHLPPPARSADVWMSGKAPQFVAEWSKVKVPWRRQQGDDGSSQSSTTAGGWRSDGGSACYEQDESSDSGGEKRRSDGGKDG